MIENYMSGFVWKYFMKNNYIKRAMKLVGFKKGEMELIPEKPPEIFASYINEKENWIELLPQKTLEYGAITKYPQDLSAKFNFKWDNENLYFDIIVKDNEIITESEPKDIYKKDCIEIFIAPDGDRLYWGNPLHFQLGFSPNGKKYAWFQEKDIEEIKMKAKLNKDSYEIKAKIPFKVLKFSPAKNKKMNLSVAVHDYDKKDDTPQCKLNLFFMPIYEKGTQKGLKLAELVLK
jgi:hypothetical protein